MFWFFFFAVSFLHRHQSLQLVLHPAIKLLVLIEVLGTDRDGQQPVCREHRGGGHALAVGIPTGRVLGPLQLAESLSS